MKDRVRRELTHVFRVHPPEDVVEWLIGGVLLAFFVAVMLAMEGVMGCDA